MLLDADPIQVPLANSEFYIAVGPMHRYPGNHPLTIGCRIPKTLSNQTRVEIADAPIEKPPGPDLRMPLVILIHS